MKNRLSWTLVALLSAIVMTLCPITLSTDVFAEEEDEEDNEEEREDEDNDSSNEEYEKDSSDQETETNEELDSGGDCNISGKGNTCIMVPANVEASGSAGPTVTSAPVQETPMLLAMPN